MTTFEGFPPGLPFPRMLELTLRNHRRGTRVPLGPFTEQLMLAIFWEESPFFTNRQQLNGGRGVGFGQVEKQELPKLTTPDAISHGYFVPGVNSSTTQLDDDRAVQVASCTLLQLWYNKENVRRSEDFALQGYGGVRQAAGTGVSREKRLQVIAGWKACERHLQALGVFSLQRILANAAFSITELEDQILAALQKSRRFDPNRKVRQPDGSQPTFRELVFPPLWFVPPEVLATFLPVGLLLRTGSSGSQVKLLQHALNAKQSSSPRLVPDGLFGPKTHAAVVGFQRSQQLSPDGIVGPKTKARLV